MLGHLWESEHAGYPGRAVLSAAMRGVPDDIGWACRVLLTGLGRLLLNPMTYVVTALGFPVQAWIVSATQPSQVAHPYATLGAVGGGALLLLAGALWWLQRLRP